MSEIESNSVAARVAMVVGRLNRQLALAHGGLSHGLLTALASVAKHGPLRLAELAALEVVAAPGASRLVAELENRGLVARKSDPDDGRAFRIEVTTAGTDAILRARTARAEVIAQLLDGLSATEIAQIEAALAPLEKVLERY